MLPMLAVRLQLGNLLAADTTTLAPAINANEVALIVAPFTPGENLTIGSLTLGSTNGLTPIACAIGPQEVAIDAVSGNQQITVVVGGGHGWRWVSSGTFTSPITVYGFALVTNLAVDLLAVEALATPIVINAAGYSIDLDPILLTFVVQPVF
jgi:hypothetical protein